MTARELVQERAAVSDGIIGVLQFAIDGVTEQQNAIANNISNAQTPGFTDTEVSFQQSLQQAIDSPGPAVASISTSQDTNGSTNGNSVNVDSELVESEKAALQYQTVSESLNAQFRLIAGSAGGSYT